LRWPNAAIADDIHLHLVTGPDPFDLCLNRTGVGINKNCHCPNVPVALFSGDPIARYISAEQFIQDLSRRTKLHRSPQPDRRLLHQLLFVCFVPLGQFARFATRQNHTRWRQLHVIQICQLWENRQDFQTCRGRDRFQRFWAGEQSFRFRTVGFDDMMPIQKKMHIGYAFAVMDNINPIRALQGWYWQIETITSVSSFLFARLTSSSMSWILISPFNDLLLFKFQISLVASQHASDCVDAHAGFGG